MKKFNIKVPRLNENSNKNNKRCEGCIYCDDYDCDNCSFNLNIARKSNCDIIVRKLITVLFALFAIAGLLSLLILLKY